jgi:hypothetical protein
VTGKLRSRDVAYTALVAAMAVFYMIPALVRPGYVIYPSWSEWSDITLIHWPKIALIRESLAQGQGWPLWSPYALSGQPLAANQLAMLFYPPALLLLAGPLSWSLALFFALHLAWAGVGAYWLARELGLRPESSILAGAIFALSGKIAAHTAIGHVSLIAAVCWVPWAFFFLHRALVRRSARWAALAGVALAAQVTTHTYALVYTAYGLLLYALLYALLEPGTLRRRVRNSLSTIPYLAPIPVIAVLLGAAQLLPLVEMSRYSNRALSFAEATLASLSPTETLTGILFPVPNVGHEAILYPGLITLGLAVGAWRARHERHVIIAASLTLLASLLALGGYTPLYRLAYAWLPGLSWMRTPGRLWFFVTLGLAILAAYGFEQWQELWHHRRRRLIGMTLMGGIGFAVAMSLGVMILLRQSGRGAWGLGVMGTLAGGLLLWGTRRRPAPSFGWLALALILADLLSFDASLIQFVPQEEVLSRGQAAASWLADQAGPFRVYSPSYSLPQPGAIDAGLQLIDGVEPVHLAAYDGFMARAGGYGESTFAVTIPPFPDNVPLDQALRGTIPDTRLLGLLNGRYLVAGFRLNQPGLTLAWQGDDTWIYENEQALSRTFVVHQTEPVTAAEVADRLQSVDLSQVALVEGGHDLASAGEAEPARIVTQSANRIVVKAELAAPGLLVLSEMWYPGWQALDNGKPSSILRTDGILRGVYLKVGSHTLAFEYRPWTVRVGLAISGCTALGLFVAFAFRAWRRA